jgi:ATP-dependent DNA ligase
MKPDRLEVPKERDKFEKFTRVMDGLMAVSYKELKQKLSEHKEEKAKKKQAKRPASHV